jgi:hypothetical protein
VTLSGYQAQSSEFLAFFRACSETLRNLTLSNIELQRAHEDLELNGEPPEFSVLLFFHVIREICTLETAGLFGTFSNHWDEAFVAREDKDTEDNETEELKNRGGIRYQLEEYMCHRAEFPNRRLLAGLLERRECPGRPSHKLHEDKCCLDHGGDEGDWENGDEIDEDDDDDTLFPP